MRKGRIFSINVSKTKGVSKTPINTAVLIEGTGLENDAHAGPGIRQVSLLSLESIRKQNLAVGTACPANGEGPRTGRSLTLKAGDFAENITTQGINLAELKIGDKLKVGKSVLLEISKIGKECHKYCSIYYKTGDCIMPREGIFAKVLSGGQISKDDDLVILNEPANRGKGRSEESLRIINSSDEGYKNV